MKKFLSLLLVATMLLTVVPIYAFTVQADPTYYDVINVNGVTGEDIVSQARTYLGVPYDTSGGNYKYRTGFGDTMMFDCSGFVYRVCRDVGLASSQKNATMGQNDPWGNPLEGQDANGNYYITADTRYQRYYGEDISSAVMKYMNTGDYSDLRPGDLLFVTPNNSDVSHVVIYSGNGMIIHSEGYEGCVAEHPISRYSYSNSSNWFFDGCRLVTEEIGYLSKCTVYPSHCLIQATGNTSANSLPCSSATDSSSEKYESVAKGDTYTAIALILNDQGNHWYRIKTSDGRTAYVPASQMTRKWEANDSATISNVVYPTSIDVGNTFIIGGDIHVEYAQLTGVSAYVYEGETWTSEPVTGGYDAASGKSYSLAGSAVDNQVLFNELPEGTYTYTIYVHFNSYYAETEKTSKIMPVDYRVFTCTFTVGDAELPATYTITYNANGGSGEPAAQTKTEGVDLQLSSQIPSRDGYTFLGWSESSTATTAAYEWGDWFTGDYSTTLYAVWQKIVFPDNFFWVTHYNEWYSEGAGVVFTEYYPEGTYLWGLHVAFDYVATVNGENVYQITDISNGLADGGASALSIPDDGFVWVINAGNDYPSLGTDAPDFTSPACFHMIDIATQWQIDDKFTFYDVDFSNVPTTTPDINWYDDDYYCTSRFYTYDGSLEYFVEYDLNGGEEGPIYQIKTHGQDLMITDVLPTWFTFNFKGWSTSSSDSSVEYYPGEYYTLDADITLYAVWEYNCLNVEPYAAQTTTVNGYNQGVYYEFIPSVSTSYLFIGLDDASIDNTFKLYDGYGNLLAENDDDAGELQFKMEYYLNAGQAYYVFVSIWNISLYESYDTSFAVCRGGYILYNANGGSGEPGGHYVYYGMSPKLSNTVPTRDGFTFLGWSTSSYATSVTYSAGASIVPSDTILYAVWQSNSSSAYAEGDVNGDGKVNLFDYMAVKSYCLDKNTLPEDQLERADLTGDGRINMFDYIALKKIVIGG